MKLSQYAKKMGVSYKTAWRWYKAGQLDAYQTSTGTVIVRDLNIEVPNLSKFWITAQIPRKERTIENIT